MADGGMTSTAGVNTLAKATGQGGSFFKADTIKPLLVGGAAGGVGVVVARYIVKDMFRTRDAAGAYVSETAADGSLTDAGKSAQMKRAAVKVLIGLGGASVFKKWSPPAALGIAIGCVVDAIADLAQARGFTMMDQWFRRTAPAAGIYGGAAGAYRRELS